MIKKHVQNTRKYSEKFVKTLVGKSIFLIKVSICGICDLYNTMQMILNTYSLSEQNFYS